MRCEPEREGTCEADEYGGDLARDARPLARQPPKHGGEAQLEDHGAGDKEHVRTRFSDGAAESIALAAKRYFSFSAYRAMRNCDSWVPICWNVVMIWFAVVSITNLSEPLAQFCNSVDCGSPPVLTWMV